MTLRDIFVLTTFLGSITASFISTYRVRELTVRVDRIGNSVYSHALVLQGQREEQLRRVEWLRQQEREAQLRDAAP